MADVEIEVEDRRVYEKRVGLDKTRLPPDGKLVYIVSHGGEEIGRWVDPICTAARWLVDHDRATREDRLVIFRLLETGRVRALTGKVGWYAARRIEETAKVGPRYVLWRPFPGVRSLQGTALDGGDDA
jgi:hypothetical protein